MKHCISYCVHGGVCILEKDHESKHNSRYCQWTDEEAISKDRADELFLLEAKWQDLEAVAEFLINIGNGIAE